MNFGDITLARSPQLRTTAAVHVPALRVILEKFLETTGGHDGTPSQRGLFQGSGRALDCLWCKENRIGFGRPVLHPKRSALPISKTVTKIVTRLCPNMPQSDQKAARPEIPALNPPRTRLLPPKLHKTGTVTGIFSVHPAAARSSMLSGPLKFLIRRRPITFRSRVSRALPRFITDVSMWASPPEKKQREARPIMSAAV